jgi:hypothetical protein
MKQMLMHKNFIKLYSFYKEKQVLFNIQTQFKF